MDDSRNWLLPEHNDRERMLDMDRRITPFRAASMAVLAVALLLAGPWVGWLTLIPLLVAAALYAFSRRFIDRVERPELLFFAIWASTQVLIAVSAILAGGAESPALSWLAIPLIGLSARFSLRGILLGVGLTVALLVGVCFGFDAQAVIDDPPLLLGPLALILSISILAAALMRSDVEHRSEAVIDPLTSMLNRKALATRIEELRQQWEVAPAPIAVVMIDIDNFKRVNDSEGHAIGDAVLRDIAYIIRKDLRAFELAYRMGGEEFLVLLPGADREQGLRLADRLRVAVHGASYGIEPMVTISCGVAASRVGEPFDFAALIESADRALYEAKRAGRNRSLGSDTGGYEAA